MLKILAEDDVANMKNLLSNGYNDKELQKELSIGKNKLLLFNPPLISVSSYLGAIKCSQYLMDNGHDLFETDQINY